MQKLLISLAAIMALSACANLEHAPTATGVSVYKYVGSVQCRGGGTPLATMMRQLSDAGIPVLDVSCGSDGRMYPSMCGAADGRIGVLQIAAANVSAADALGFAPLTRLPDATKLVCP